MKLILYCFLLVLPLSVFSQKDPKIEDFINQIYSEIVPSDFRFYNLVDSSFVYVFDDFSFELDKALFNGIKSDHSDFSLDELKNESKKSVLINWRVYNLEKAKVSSQDSIPKYFGWTRFTRAVPFNTSKSQLAEMNKTKKINEIFLPIRKTWSNKKISKKSDKAWEKYANSFEKENKTYFEFSTPVFFGNFALIQYYGRGGGATLIFKNVNGHWEKITMFNLFAY